ncbi:MAG TPA: hypothetical protein VJR29_05215 [bacterium]|nr:hypothetical protein [bacterium]
MEKAFVQSETNANFFFDLLSQEPGFSDASLDGAHSEEMAGGPGTAGTKANAEKDNKIQGREVIAAAFNKITKYYPKITEHFKNLGLDLTAMVGTDGKIKADFIAAAKRRLMGEDSAAKTKSLDFLAAQFLIAEQTGVSNKDPLFLEKWEAFSKLPEKDRKDQVNAFLKSDQQAAKFVRWAFRLSELSLLPFNDQVAILKEWGGVGEASAKAGLAPLWQDRGLPKVVAQAALLKGLDLEEQAKALSDDAAKPKLAEARLLFRAAAELDNENPLARRRLAIYLVREGKLSSAGFHIGVAIQNETELRYILENVAGLQKQDARLYAPAPDAYSFAADQLIQAKRYDTAALVYGEAAKAAQARGDSAANTAFIQKKLAAEESAKPFEILFTDKNNPVAARLYKALRDQGIPSSLMESAVSNDHKVSAKEVLSYLGQNWNDPRVRKALQALKFPTLPWDVPGAKLPYDNEAFRKLDFAGKMLAWHDYDVAEMKKQEPVDGKEIARHQRLASYYDPENPARKSELGETLLQLRDYPAAATAFEEAFADGGSKDFALKTKAGAAHFGAGDFEKSRAAYTAVLEKNPKDAQVLMLRYEASKEILQTVDEAKDPKRYKELSAAAGADYAMSLTLKPETEKAKIKDIEKALEGLHANNGDKAKAVAKLAGLKEPEQAGGITKREVLAAVEGLAENYLKLAEQSYADPKDVETVRAGMNGLASETFGVLARFAQADSDPEVQKMAVIYESYQLIAEGKLDAAVEKLKPVEKMPEASRVLATLEKGKLRLYNEAALQVWEVYNQDLEQAELSESKGWYSGIGMSSSDVTAKFKLEKELTDAVRLKIETGEAFTLKDALSQISTDGAENLRERAKFLLSPAALTGDQSAAGDIIDLVHKVPPIMERSQRILQKAWSLEKENKALNGALALYGLIHEASDDDFMKERAKKGLDALQGNASFGRSFEKISGQVFGAANSKNVFVDIGFMFVAAGLGNLVKLQMLRKFEQAGVSGYKAIVIAGGLGLGAEVTTLWGLNTLKEAALSDPSKVFTAEHLAKSYGATLIMIGGLKGFGKVGQTLGPKAAKSLKLLEANGTQLSKGGQRLVWGFGHSAGLAGMIATSHINQGLNLTPKPIGGWKEGLVHEVLGYTQFALAHGAADRLVGGKMHETSMRQHGEVAYRESLLLARGHADAMGFKAEALKIQVAEDGKLKVDGKPLEEFDAESKSFIETQLVKAKDGTVKDQTIFVDGSSRRLLVTLMTDAGLNRPGFSGLWLRQLIQGKMFAEANAYLDKYSVPLRFGKDGQVIAMGSQPGSAHSLLGIISEGGKVEPISDDQIRDLTPTPIQKPKRKGKKDKVQPDAGGEDSPFVPARKALPPAKTGSKPPPPPLRRPISDKPPTPKALPPIQPLQGARWVEDYTRIAEAEFAGKETMFREGYNTLNDRVKKDGRFNDAKFCAAMEREFRETLDALRPILEKMGKGEPEKDGDPRTVLGQALFVNVVEGKLTLADARQLTAGALAGHYRVEKAPGNEYRLVPLYHGVEVKPGTSLLVGKSGKEVRAIPGQGLVNETLAGNVSVNFEFRQQGGKTTAIFEGRPGEAIVEVLDPKTQDFRRLKADEKVEIQDGEVVLLGGDPYVFRSAETLAKDLKARTELLEERDAIFYLRGRVAQLENGTSEWKREALNLVKRTKAFDQLLERDARNSDGSSSIETELVGLAGGTTPFAPAARQALKAELNPADYRAAQVKIAEPMVESHREAMEEVYQYLNGLYADEMIEHRLSQQLNDHQGKLIDNPHVRLKDPADVAPKIARRGWLAMEPMTDYAGARIVVKNTNDAMVVAADIEKNLKVRDVYTEKGHQEMDIIGQEYVGGKETMEVTFRKDKDHPDRLLVGSSTGYRAMHIVVEHNGKPVEIQIQTESIFKWGKIQHSLIYKNQNLPAETFKQLNDYCRDVAAYLTALEDGQGKSAVPRPADPALSLNLPKEQRLGIERDIEQMDRLMDFYEKVDESDAKTRIIPRSQLEGSPKPVSDSDVTKKMRLPIAPPPPRKDPKKDGVPERRGAAGGAKADLSGISDSKSPVQTSVTAELHFGKGRVLKINSESKVAILGSGAGAELRIEGNKAIAAEHAEITRDAKGRSFVRPLHGNSVEIRRENRWVELSRDGKAGPQELVAGDRIRIGGIEFTWKPAPAPEQSKAKVMQAPTPPPLPKDRLMEEAYQRHADRADGKGTDLAMLIETSDKVLAGEQGEWSPSYAPSFNPDRSNVPVVVSPFRLTKAEFAQAKEKGELQDTAPLTLRVTVRGEQRQADLKARLQTQYGASLHQDPKDGSWMLRNSAGQAQVKVVFESRQLKIFTPDEARALYEQFAGESLPLLTAWHNDPSGRLTVENSYAYRMLLLVGPGQDAQGKLRFGTNFEEAVRRYETETDPVQKARAGETLATLCAYLQDTPVKIQEFKLLEEVAIWKDNQEFANALNKARDAGGALATEAKVAFEALQELQHWGTDLRSLGEVLRAGVPIADRRAGEPKFDAYQKKADDIRHTLNEIRDFSRRLEEAGLKRKGPPPLPDAKKDIQGASDQPSFDVRSFDPVTLESLRSFGVLNVEKLKDPTGPEYAQTLINGMDHLLKQPVNGHANHEMLVGRLITALREWERRSGTRVEGLEEYLQFHGRDRLGVPFGAPLPVTPPPERLSLSATEQERLQVSEINSQNVLTVVEKIRAETTQIGKIGGFKSFRLDPANETLLWRILQNFGPYIQHMRPELGSYLSSLFEARQVYKANLETEGSTGGSGENKVPERRGETAAARKTGVPDAGDPLGFHYVEEIPTHSPLGKELHSLAHPRPPLSKLVPGLTRELEAKFERGARVQRWPNGQMMLADPPSGSDSVVIRPATPTEVKAYLAWKEKRGFVRIPSVQGLKAWKALEARAKELGVLLYEGADPTQGPLQGAALREFVAKNGGQIAQLQELFDFLPASYFGAGRIKRIFLKSPRQDDAHFSAYDAATGSLYLYSGAFAGSKRNMAAIFLHETGHGNAARYRLNSEGDSQIPWAVRHDVAQAHRVIVKGKALFALEWGGGKAERLRMQEQSFEEWLADVQLAYVAAGPELRAHINKLPENSAERKAWDYVYTELSDRVFEGTEYDYPNPAGTKTLPPDQRKTLKYIPGGKSETPAKDPGPVPTRIEVPEAYLHAAQGAQHTVESVNWGGIAASRHPGIGAKEKGNNEDRYSIGSFDLPDGSHVTRSYVIDGMGGQGEGKGELAGVFIRYVLENASRHPQMKLEDAIQMADRQWMEHPTHREIAGRLGLDKAPGAVVLGMEVHDKGKGDYDVKFAHVGDSEGFLMDAGFNVDPAAYTTREFLTNRVLPRGLTLFMRVNPYRNAVDQALGSRQKDQPALRVDTSTHKAQKGQIAVLGSDGLFENFIGKGEMADLLKASGAKTSGQMQMVLMNEALIRMSIFDRFARENRCGQAITHGDYVQAYQEVWGSPPPAGQWRYEGMILTGKGLILDPRVDQATDKAKGYRGSFKRDNITVLVQILGEKVTSKAKAEENFRPAAILGPTGPMTIPDPSPILEKLMNLKP